MSLRFFKKANGESILQEYNHSKGEYVDIPEVSESPKGRIIKAIHERQRDETNFLILISSKFHESLRLEDLSSLDTIPLAKDITSINGFRVYVTHSMVSDFKFVKEI